MIRVVFKMSAQGCELREPVAIEVQLDISPNDTSLIGGMIQRLLDEIPRSMVKEHEGRHRESLREEWYVLKGLKP